MARPKKVSVETTETPTDVEVKVEKTFTYHPEEVEVESNGKLYLTWTDTNGCTFKEPKL